MSTTKTRGYVYIYKENNKQTAAKYTKVKTAPKTTAMTVTFSILSKICLFIFGLVYLLLL